MSSQREVSSKALGCSFWQNEGMVSTAAALLRTVPSARLSELEL